MVFSQRFRLQFRIQLCKVNSIRWINDSLPSVDAIELINELNYLCQVGWATRVESVQLWNAETGKLSDFTSHFNTQGLSTYGHGRAFFIAPVGFEIPPNSTGGFKQGKKDYITEVKTVSQLRHRNLVQLMGWCHDRGELLLVYEFTPNGSLHSHLFGKKSRLNRAMRYKISLGLTSALLYLHEEREQCVVLRDVKSSNIMLDVSFNAKLGNFVLDWLMDHELGPQTTGLAGTLSYLDPEYISTWRASKDSGVYSFGVIALEIASERKAIDSVEGKTEMNLVGWSWELYGEGMLGLAVDMRLGSDFEK